MKKTFWYRKDKDVESITCEKTDKLTSLTPMLYGKLASMIFAYCKSKKQNVSSRKITVTLTG